MALASARGSDAARQEQLRRHLVFRSRDLNLLPGIHAEQITDAHRFEIGARFGGRFAGEELQDFVIDAELALRNGHANCGRSETFAQ